MSEMNHQTVYSMLREIKSVAMESSLTGGLKRGSRILVDVYNRCLNTLSEEDPVVKKLFPPLGAEGREVHIDEIGVAAALLSRYVVALDGKDDRYENRYDHEFDDDDDY